MIRVVLPAHLKALARVSGEVEVEADPTVDAVLSELEQRYPALRGTIRDQRTGARRAYVRYYACELDLSHEPTGQPLPVAVAEGREPLIVLGAMSGG